MTAVDPVRRRALQLASESLDFKIAAGLSITDPDAYAAPRRRLHGPSREELAAEQRPDGHKDCTRCRGKGLLPDWSGWSYIERPCPDRPEPDDEDPGGATTRADPRPLPGGHHDLEPYLRHRLHDAQACLYQNHLRPPITPPPTAVPGSWTTATRPRSREEPTAAARRPALFRLRDGHGDDTPCAPPPEKP